MTLVYWEVVLVSGLRLENFFLFQEVIRNRKGKSDVFFSCLAIEQALSLFLLFFFSSKINPSFSLAMIPS